MTDQATVVLVHGAGAGAWTWHLVVDELRARGIDVVAADLPSADAPDNSTDPMDDVAYVREVVDGIDGPAILVGNSYGGFVISAAAVDQPKVRRLVFVAAVMPDPGRPLMETMMEATAPGDALGLTMLDDGRIVFEPEADLASSYQLAPPEEIAFVRSHLGRPMSLGTAPASLDTPGWETVPSTYVVCTEDRALKVDVQREWARERATTFVEWPVDHCPQHSHPGLVVDLLQDLATQADDDRR